MACALQQRGHHPAWGGSISADALESRSREPEARRWRLHAIVAGLWIALSIAVIGYATLEGELALADLDGLELLAAYAWEPLDDAKR